MCSAMSSAQGASTTCSRSAAADGDWCCGSRSTKRTGWIRSILQRRSNWIRTCWNASRKATGIWRTCRPRSVTKSSRICPASGAQKSKHSTRAGRNGWRDRRSRLMRLLLISNSTLHGSGYLDHCAGAITSFLGSSVSRVLFVPYAIFDRDGYAAKARARFEAMGFGLDSVHDLAGGPVRAIEIAEALFIGGGNTFRLLDSLWRQA